MQSNTIQTTSSEETEKFGEQLGKKLKGGEVIELISDLGGGKTTLTRGVAKGVGSSDVVGSPTFTLSKVYVSLKFNIHHFDFYRLSEAGLMEHELHDLIADPKVVVIVEWGDVVQHVLPELRMTIRIKALENDGREITSHFPEELSYMMEPA